VLDESGIENDIAALRQRHKDTKALYREVCALLFFRYGVTPTASKLYQYVRKGSMGTPAEVLAQFWQDLRDKSRVQIEHPDLPDTLKEVAAEAVQRVWQQATQLARDELAAFRAEAQQALSAARTELDQSERQGVMARLQAQQAQERLKQQEAELAESRCELEVERRAHAATAARLQEVLRQSGDLQGQLERSRADFAEELRKTRAEIAGTEERSAAAQRRAFLELDQERVSRAKADKQAEILRAQVAACDARGREAALAHANAATALQASLNSERERVEPLRAALAAADSERKALREAATAAQNDALQRATEAATLRSMLETLRPSAKSPTKTARKTKSA
jgi:hypothetical protein